MWDAWNVEAQYRTEQIRRARGLDADHHRSAGARTRAQRWIRRTRSSDGGVGGHR